jgi:hypothetical protein
LADLDEAGEESVETPMITTATDRRIVAVFLLLKNRFWVIDFPDANVSAKNDVGAFLSLSNSPQAKRFLSKTPKKTIINRKPASTCAVGNSGTAGADDCDVEDDEGGDGC